MTDYRLWMDGQSMQAAVTRCGHRCRQRQDISSPVQKTQHVLGVCVWGWDWTAQQWIYLDFRGFFLCIFLWLTPVNPSGSVRPRGLRSALTLPLVFFCVSLEATSCRNVTRGLVLLLKQPLWSWCESCKLALIDLWSLHRPHVILMDQNSLASNWMGEQWWMWKSAVRVRRSLIGGKNILNMTSSFSGFLFKSCKLDEC